METKKLTLTVLVLLLSMAVNAQTTVKGTLRDSLSQEGEPYATIRIYKGKSVKEPAVMGLTELDGSFSQAINGKGDYTITFNSVGRHEVRRQLHLNGQATVDLGILYVTDDSKTLAGVEVVAQKPLVKMETDKMSYNVADDTDSKTATVLDMLRKVPMVTVDGQDNITVNGSSSFKVYVNGKPSMMMQSNPSQIFKSMPASMVKSIEVVTNPGARYEAEGASGVLNIIMGGQDGQQATINGVNGSLRLTGGNRQQDAGLFLSGQYGKFSFSLNSLLNYSKMKGTEIDITREQYSSLGTSTMDYSQTSTTRTPFKMGNLIMGYELDSMSSINATIGIHSFATKVSGNPVTRMHGGFYGDGYSYSQWMKTESERTSLEASLDYQRFLNPAKTSSIAVVYQFSLNPTTNDNWSNYDNDPSTGTVLPLDFSDRYSHAKEKSTEHTLQADYTTPLTANQKLNLGAKLTARDNSSDSRYYDVHGETQTYNPALSSDYSHSDDILGAYAEYDAQFGKVGTKAGLRYEHTWQDVEFRLGNGQDFKKDYGNLVPSLSLSYQLMPTANIGLTYNMRISRPGISYLNPYVDRSSNTALTYGNPDLDVEKSHNIGLVANLYTPKFMGNLNIRHSITDNGISQYSFYDSDNLLNTTYGNVVRQRNTTVSLWASLMLSPKTRIFMNGGFGYIDLHSDELDASNHGWQGNAMVGLQQTLPWDLKLGTYLITNSRRYTLQGWSSGFNVVVGSLTKSFLNDKLSVGVQAMTALNKGGKLHLDSYSAGKDFTSKQQIHVPISNVSVTVTWNFGNSKVKAKTSERRIENDVIEKKMDMEQMNDMQQNMQ